VIPANSPYHTAHEHTANRCDARLASHQAGTISVHAYFSGGSKDTKSRGRTANEDK
jgi:hypothetical protein